MTGETGDYLSRFDRVEKTLESVADRLDTLTGDVVRLHESMNGQKENTDNLLIALRQLIDRIPPENLR